MGENPRILHQVTEKNIGGHTAKIKTNGAVYPPK